MNDPADIQAMALKARADHSIYRHQKMIEHLTGALGRPLTFYLTLGIVFAWVTINTLLLGTKYVLDVPPFFWLQGVASVGGLLMTMLILITQNRQQKHQEQRFSVDLEINLVSELKITKLIQLIEELRHDLPSVRDRVDLQAEAMKTATDPHAILSAIEASDDNR